MNDTIMSNSLRVIEENFNNNVLDQSVNGNDGTIVGNPYYDYENFLEITTPTQAY